ncbi:MAG TPA: hypothetical protein V6D08_18165 [Candidatus Obscuribacterales bacterium]
MTEEGAMVRQQWEQLATPQASSADCPPERRLHVEAWLQDSRALPPTLDLVEDPPAFKKRPPAGEPHIRGQRALKELSAQLAQAGNGRSFESAELSDTGKLELGRYALTYDSIAAWLRDLRLDPPSRENLDTAVARGKLSPELADLLASTRFQSLMTRLHAGLKPTAEELKEALPPVLQERIAGDLVYKFAAYSTDKNGQVDVGKVALALKLGRMPTRAERLADDNRRLEQEGAQLFFSNIWESPGGTFLWRNVEPAAPVLERASYEPAGNPTDAQRRLRSLAENIARSRNTVGRCYNAVADALDSIGVHLTGESAYMAASQLASDSRFEEVALSCLQPGDILVHGKNGAHPDGHIAVYLGGGLEASDHIQELIRGEGYGGTRVFRLKGSSA